MVLLDRIERWCSCWFVTLFELFDYFHFRIDFISVSFNQQTNKSQHELTLDLKICS